MTGRSKFLKNIEFKAWAGSPGTKENVMQDALQKFLMDEEGATAIEYGLIAGLIAVVLVASLTGVGTKLKAMFNYITQNIQNTSTAS